MSVDTDQVFLVPGQWSRPDSSGEERLAPEIAHHVVVARNAQSAMALLEQTTPDFRPLGATSLKEYEDAVLKLRATLNGEETGWPMVIAPGIG